MATTGARPGRRMVSLGKVTAPKPINLPSQRYGAEVHVEVVGTHPRHRRENNGLDPSVNLVSKASTSGVWGADGAPPGPKDSTGAPPQGAPPGQQPPMPRAGSSQSAAWGGAGLPEVRQATALLSKEEFPTLGAAEDGGAHKRRESSRLSNRGSDLDRGHWDSDDRAIDHDYRGREYAGGDYGERYDRHPRDAYPHERDWGPRHPPPPPRRGYDGYDDYYRGRYSPDDRRRDDGYYRGPPPHHGGYRDQHPPPPPPRYHDAPYRDEEGPRGRRTPDWGPPSARDNYRGPPGRPERDWDGPDGPPRERSNGYGHHGPRHPRVQPPPPPPPRRPAPEGDEGPRKAPPAQQQRFSPEWGRPEPAHDARREHEEQALPDTPTRSPRSPRRSPQTGPTSPRQPTKIILKRDGPPEVPQDAAPPPPPPRAARRAEPPAPRADPPPQPPPKQQPATLPVARDPVLPTHSERGPAVPPRMQPGAPSVQQQMQQLQQAHPPSGGLGLSTQLHGLFPPNQYGEGKDASRAPLAGLQEGSLPVPSMGGGGFLGAKPADLHHKAQPQQQQPPLGGFGGSLSGGMPAFNLFGPTTFNPMQQGHALFTPDLLGTAQGLSSPSAPRGPLDAPTQLPVGPLAAAGPTGLGRPAASPGSMLFGQFGELGSSPPVRAGVQMPSAATAVAAAEAVVNEGQPASYEEQRVFMQARAAQKKEERRTMELQQARGKPMQPSTPSADGSTQPGEGGRGRRRGGGGRGGSSQGPADDASKGEGGERKPARRGSGRGGRAGGSKDGGAATTAVAVAGDDGAPAPEGEATKTARSRSRGGRRSSNSNAPAAGAAAAEGAQQQQHSAPASAAPPPAQPQGGKPRARGSRGGGGRNSGAANNNNNTSGAADAKSGAAPQHAGGSDAPPPGTAQATAPPRARPRSGGRGRGRGGARAEGSSDAPAAAPVPAAATA